MVLIDNYQHSDNGTVTNLVGGNLIDVKRNDSL